MPAHALPGSHANGDDDLPSLSFTHTPHSKQNTTQHNQKQTTAARAAVISATFPTFLQALTETPHTNYGRQIVEGLKLQSTLSNPNLALTVFMPEDKYFDALARKLGVAPTQMNKNVGLMKQVLFYHFVTGSGGVKQTFTTAGLRPGMKLDTMYVSTSTKKPYQLAVAERDGKIQIKSVGTTAYIVKSNVKCGAGYAHIINNVLVPMSLSSIPVSVLWLCCGVRVWGSKWREGLRGGGSLGRGGRNIAHHRRVDINSLSRANPTPKTKRNNSASDPKAAPLGRGGGGDARPRCHRCRRRSSSTVS